MPAEDGPLNAITVLKTLVHRCRAVLILTSRVGNKSVGHRAKHSTIFAESQCVMGFLQSAKKLRETANAKSLENAQLTNARPEKGSKPPKNIGNVSIGQR